MKGTEGQPSSLRYRAGERLRPLAEEAAVAQRSRRARAGEGCQEGRQQARYRPARRQKWYKRSKEDSV